MSENDRIEILGENFTRAELRKLAVEVIKRCQNIFPPGKDQQVLVAFAREFFAESGLTALELRAVQIGRNLTFVVPAKPDHGSSPFDAAIEVAHVAWAEAQDIAGAGLEKLVAARRAITTEESERTVDRARLEAIVVEATRVSENYKDLNKAAVRCQAHVNGLCRARDSWFAIREYHAAQKK